MVLIHMGKVSVDKEILFPEIITWRSWITWKVSTFHAESFFQGQLNNVEVALRGILL